MVQGEGERQEGHRKDGESGASRRRGPDVRGSGRLWRLHLQPVTSGLGGSPERGPPPQSHPLTSPSPAAPASPLTTPMPACLALGCRLC